MNKFILLTITMASLLLSSALFAQKSKVTLSGNLRDQESGEDLIGATVFIRELKTGVAANVYGFYSVSVPPGNYTVEYSFLGYQTDTMLVDLTTDKVVNKELGSGSTKLQEVEIFGEAGNKNVEDVRMSTINMKMETIKKVPALMGEVDVLRVIQLYPGVQSGGEGSTGFFVRGGGIDQNLILLDEAPVYNPAHLFGFFSVFNQDAIKSADLYKGGIPSRYGGRLSSVLDVRMNDGNSKKLTVKGGIGILASRLTIEGPIVKDKVSFIVSGRRTYADLFLKVLPKGDARRDSKLYFYDLNGKINWRVNDNNRVYLSGYFGRDNLSAGDAFNIGWGNTTLTTRWNHIFSKKVFSNLSFVFSNFDYSLGVPSGPNEFLWTSSILNYSLKNDYTYYLNAKNTVEFGFISTVHNFKPAEVKPGDENQGFNEINFSERFAWENGVYLANEQRFGSRVTAEYGVRFSSFTNVGPDSTFTYDADGEIKDAKAYSKGDMYNTYSGFEPRLGLKVSLDDVSSIKASYNRMQQYLQLATNSTGGAPLDIWMPSSNNIKPGIADQVALGYFRNFKKNTYEASVEGYYKWMQNQVDFVDNAEVLLNRHIESDIRQGKGWAYGAEFFVKKNKGDLTGWVSYTLSWAYRQTDGINNGNKYFSAAHRNNNLAIVAMYKLNDKFSLAANWVYSSGAAITTPTGRFEYGGQINPVYADRNDAQMPDYHRLDLGLDWKLGVDKPKKKFEHSLNFSIYNVYNRHNAYTINFVEDSDNVGTTIAEKTYLFGILPSITWNFIWK
ncbi:MAG: TonB-dependent receptor [Salibacteraceae bacterium]